MIDNDMTRECVLRALDRGQQITTDMSRSEGILALAADLPDRRAAEKIIVSHLELVVASPHNVPALLAMIFHIGFQLAREMHVAGVDIMATDPAEATT